MSTKVVKSEAGYSMVEVLVAILILAVAIIPMVGMFDAGLRAAVVGSNYDQARALANANMESVKSMKFSEPATARCPTMQSGFDCSVTTSYVYLDTSGDSATFKNSGPSNPEDMLKVVVTVEWPSGSSYKTTGLVAK